MILQILKFTSTGGVIRFNIKLQKCIRNADQWYTDRFYVILNGIVYCAINLKNTFLLHITYFLPNHKISKFNEQLWKVFLIC